MANPSLFRPASPFPSAALLPAAEIQAHHAEISRLTASIEMLGTEAMLTAMHLAAEAGESGAEGVMVRMREVRELVKAMLDMAHTEALCPDFAGELAHEGLEQAARLVAAREALPR